MATERTSVVISSDSIRDGAQGGFLDPVETRLSVDHHLTLIRSCGRSADHGCFDIQPHVGSKETTLISIFGFNFLLVDPHAGEAVVQIGCTTVDILTGCSHQEMVMIDIHRVSKGRKRAGSLCTQHQTLSVDTCGFLKDQNAS